MPRFVVSFDVPGIKAFVFGTDPLREIRGGSSLLVRLNQLLPDWLEATAKVRWESVYSNGGSAQFVAEAEDAQAVQSACRAAALEASRLTAGQSRLLFGIGRWDHGTGPVERQGDQAYQVAVSKAQWQLRQRRELASRHACVDTWPLFRECQSASHLPAQVMTVPAGASRSSPRRVALSAAANLKSQRSLADGQVAATASSPWQGWLRHLSELHRDKWVSDSFGRRLRCRDFNEVAGQDRGRSRLGLVYADGNAMGKLLPSLDSPAAYEAFSSIVDSSIHAACYEALDEVCRDEIEGNLSGSTQRLPADILLLGGDDLVVVLPARRALRFAEEACRRFEEITAQKIADLPAGAARDCFSRLGVQRFSISCGVAIASSHYPFGLLLDLAESLLKQAKQGGSQASLDSEFEAPSMIDFHAVTSASSYELGNVRAEEYGVGQPEDVPRTARPFTLEQIAILRQSISSLQEIAQPIPRGKLKAILQTSLERKPFRARMLSKEIFTRLTALQQGTLITIMRRFDSEFQLDYYPWIRQGQQQAGILVDLVEAFDLYPALREKVS